MDCTRNEPRRLRWGLALLVGIAGVSTASAAPMTTDPIPAALDRFRQEAEAFEKQGQWEKACEVYLKIIARDRQQPAVRERLHFCLRHVQLTRRHSDPTFRAKVRNLKTADALDLYEEVVSNLHYRYVDRAKVSLERIYRNGLEELCLALEDESFRQSHLSKESAGKLRSWAENLRQSPHAHPSLRTIKDVVGAARKVARETDTRLGLKASVSVVEFICGSCNALDEYTAFLPAEQVDEDLSALTGEVPALGFSLVIRGDQLLIDRVVPGSWAASLPVPLKEGERVLRIGDKPVPERPTPEAVAEMLRTDAGLIGKIEVSDGMQARVVPVPQQLPSVVGATLLDDDKGIGYLRVISFQKSTPQEFEDALLWLRTQGMKGLILDLRGNPGGLFAAAVQLSGRFLSDRVIIATQGRVPLATKTFTAPAGGMNALDVPLVVLVDAETASAAEVVACALKENERAILVGQPTFGKGSIQCVLQLKQATGLRLTLARFVSPRGQVLHGVGVTPHIFEAGSSRQLEAAVEQASRLLAMRP